MENDGAIGLTHRSCFRAAAAPTLATRVATICRIILDDLLFLKATRQGRRGYQVAWGALDAGMRNADRHHCT